MSRLCLECGGSVPSRVKGCGGNQPGFCSDECRRKRKQQTFSRWVAENKERKRASDAQFRKLYKQANPAYFREHYAANKEKLKHASREWYHANTERANKRQKAYAIKRLIEQPSHVRAIANRQQAKRRAIKKHVFIEVVDRRIVFDRDKGKCGICMGRVDPTSKWEIDHVIPIAKGGAHSYDNVQLAHRKCNRSKNASVPKGQPTLFQVVPS